MEPSTAIVEQKEANRNGQNDREMEGIDAGAANASERFGKKRGLRRGVH
jgi:hypothetical protein